MLSYTPMGMGSLDAADSGLHGGAYGGHDGGMQAHLRAALITKINSFLPEAMHQQTEKRFNNSSIKEMRCAVGR